MAVKFLLILLTILSFQFAFGNDVVEKIKIPQLKTRITKLIAKNLGVDLGFEL